MADDKQIVFEISARIDKLEAAMDKAAKKTESTFGQMGAALNITAINQGLELARKVAGVIKDTIGAAFDAAMDAEKIRSINNQFDTLSKQAGIAGENMKEGLQRAAGGLIDTDELLQSANRAMVQLGSSAKQLPQVMELAKKATNLFGGELVQNFEAMNQAIATGNTRSLKQLGIIIDTEKALKDFARTQGVSAAALTEAGRQQAIMNAVLAKGEMAFAGVTSTVGKTTQEVKRFWVGIKEASDAVKIAFESVFGGFLTALLKDASNKLKVFSDTFKAAFGSGEAQISAQREILERELTAMEKRFDQFSKRPDINSSMLDQMKKEVSAKRLQLDLLNEQLRKSESQKAQAAANSPVSAAISPLVDHQKVASEAVKTDQFLSRLNEERIQSQMSNATTVAQVQAGIDEQILQQRRTFELQKEALDLEFAQKGQLGSAAYLEAVYQMHQANDAKIIGLTVRRNQVLSELDKMLRSGIVGGITSAMSAFGAALAKGSNAFEAFSKAIIGAIGGLAIQIGSFLVATGLGFTAAGAILPAWATAGAGTVAAGLGLIALGGAMQAMGSGGGGDTGGGVGAGSGGGGGYSGSSISELDEKNSVEKQTQVVINVQGNVLDRRQTGLELAEAFLETINTNGIVAVRT